MARETVRQCRAKRTGSTVNVVNGEDGRPVFYLCPDCGELLLYSQNFCAKCGKRIIWPEEVTNIEDNVKMMELLEPEYYFEYILDQVDQFVIDFHNIKNKMKGWLKKNTMPSYIIKLDNADDAKKLYELSKEYFEGLAVVDDAAQSLTFGNELQLYFLSGETDDLRSYDGELNLDQYKMLIHNLSEKVNGGAEDDRNQ